ncbi:MAG: hypothetical protein A3F84_29330 [Candidatus Handelsmanbacteria bacterium RIFCSPLOWO2_12_FULL_64_10]|uniref:PIN domain-containing protein n=1 Tax=Handelsmanbacteria sp. (strain RIFCSPLOWO2_12_FULL_64_10) TaxID=1817868 RepID=A0A1F6D2E1_HANXR|nr:MAG: hypothetical protein A3F84_29330 [Candidatus Handelsmanbacteria bacterium RIFCSPLOWO2_12_FULL_64_10]
MKVYIDTSCLKRPFDDQTQAKIRLETEAILMILKDVERGRFQWYGSDVLLYENRNNPNSDRRKKAAAMLAMCSVVVEFSEVIEARGTQLSRHGISALDALHLASAEEASVETFLTCDDRLLRRIKQSPKIFRLPAQNPVDFLKEIDL